MFTEEKNEFYRDYINIGDIFICTHCAEQRFVLYMLTQTVENTVRIDKSWTTFSKKKKNLYKTDQQEF